MKKHIRLLIVLGCLGFLLAACRMSVSDLFSSAQREHHATPTLALSLPTTTPESFRTGIAMIEVYRVETSEEFSYTIDMTHPELQDAGEDTERFNGLLNEKMLASVEGFRESAKESYQALSDVGGQSFYTLDYAVYYFDERFISLQLFIQVYIIGAAHPGLQHIVVNYDLQEHREATLGELFLPDSRILEVLQYYCTAELDARFPDGYFQDGLKPVMENYRHWNLSEEGLVLTFQTYQVQAGAAGPQTVVIPYSWLEPYANPNGPLNFILNEKPPENTF